PDVVVDLPAAAVQFEHPGRDHLLDGEPHSSTTDRSTSPRATFEKAASTSSRPMVSDTKASRSRRPWRYRSMSIGKSRDGRQSPNQDDFSAPPRPNTSNSGSSMRISGVGTPTSTTVPARSRA